MQANDAEGRKNDRLRKEKKRRGRNLIKVNRYLQRKKGFQPRANSGWWPGIRFGPRPVTLPLRFKDAVRLRIGQGRREFPCRG